MNSRAAVWRDADGRAVKTTTDEFYCLEPVHPRDLAARTEDGEYETVLRCRSCINCRRYEAWVLRRELAETYKEETDELWILTVEAEQVEHSRLAARIRRSGVGTWEPCLYRDGVSAFKMVARGQRPALQLVRALHSRTFRLEAIGRGRKPRQFRSLTRGLLVAREHYGAWANRFYHRARVRLPGEAFALERQGGIRKRHPDAKAGVRAWKRGLSLYPSGSASVAELMALVLKRDGHLNGRKCTHAKCPDARCHYAHRAMGATFSINQRPRVSAASASLNDRISECAAGVGASKPLQYPTPTALPSPAALPSKPRLTVSIETGSRDAGSLPQETRFMRELRERWEKKGYLKPRDTT